MVEGLTPLHVGLDARMWHHTGIGRHIRNLATHLEGVALTIWARPSDVAAVQAALSAAKVLPCPAPLFSISEQLFFARALRQEPLDVFHAPHLNLPLACPVPLVVTLHDLIPLACPGTIQNPLGLLYFRLMANLAVRRADAVIAVSHHTRDDLVARLGADPARITVIHNGCEPAFGEPVPPERIAEVRTRHGLTGPTLLYAGQWKRYKNLEILFEALHLLRDTHPDLKLVLVGKPDPQAGHVQDAIARLRLTDRVVVTGWIAEEADLRALYQGATVFAFPSRYEGFGLPPLEAMAAGVPVVAANATSLPEVVGDAGILVDPDDARGWAEALDRVITDPALRESLVASGRLRAERFDWRASAAHTRAVYDGLFAPPSRKESSP